MSVHPTSRRGFRLSNRAEFRGYTLVVCEKPDAARRVAEALSLGAPEVFSVGDVPVFRLSLIHI